MCANPTNIQSFTRQNTAYDSRKGKCPTKISQPSARPAKQPLKRRVSIKPFKRYDKLSASSPAALAPRLHPPYHTYVPPHITHPHPCTAVALLFPIHAGHGAGLFARREGLMLLQTHHSIPLLEVVAVRGREMPCQHRMLPTVSPRRCYSVPTTEISRSHSSLARTHTARAGTRPLFSLSLSRSLVRARDSSNAARELSRRGVKMYAHQSTRRTWSPCRCSAQNPHQRLCGRERTSCSRSTAGTCPRSRAWAGAAGVHLSMYARANARMACVCAY